jgi:TRAP-type C4-dicarboxylate transport system permease small subunit
MTIKTLRRQAIALGLGLALFVPMVAMAQPSTNNFGLNQLNNIDLGRNSLQETISIFINVILGFLGIVAFIIILLGGFKWMTSGGDEDKIGEAKKLMGAGVVGMAIVLAAWAIASFVINQLALGTGAIPAA